MKTPSNAASDDEDDIAAEYARDYAEFACDYIDLEIIFGHNLDSDRIANLPTLINQYFAPHLQNIQLRLGHGDVWNPVKTPSGSWKWEENRSDDFAESRNLLEIGAVWQWCYEENSGESFEEWFQTQKSKGEIYIIGFAGMILSVGERAVCLDTGIRWDHFLLDSLIKEDLRNFIPYLLDFFGSNYRSIIYVSEGCRGITTIDNNFIMEGWSIEQIIYHANNTQPPVKSIKDLIITNNGEIASLKYDGYYVESL